jgi:DnaD/phage-associated family protein
VSDLVADPTLSRSLRGGARPSSPGPASADWPGIEGLDETGPSAVLSALDGLLAAGILLEAVVGDGPLAERWVFRNDPSGRRARDRAQTDGMPRDTPAGAARAADLAATSIYALYEENIGPLTPLIAEELADAEALHSPQRIETAFRAAVEANVRRWSYVKAVLERMSREKSNAASRQGGGGARERYLEGEYAGFVDG